MILTPQVRLAVPRDAAVIAEMSRDYIEHGLGWSWTGPRIIRAIHDAATNVAVIHEHRLVLAFGIMHYGELKAHLALLGVHRSRRRRGLARHLLAWLELCANTAGVERIQVEARADNPEALAFYRALGYRQIERIRGYYRGEMDALRLEKQLWLQPSAARPG
jgi:ribosomal protein S18 acetylase RimI-like enzyme